MLITILLLNLAQAAEVKVTGDIKPNLNIMVTQEDLVDLEEAKRTLERFEPTDLKREELLEEGDAEAFQLVGQELKSHLLKLAIDWAKLRSIRYRAAAEIAGATQARDHRRTKRLYRKKQQASYEQVLISAIAFADGDMAQTIAACKSLTCVTAVRDAIYELINLARELNFTIKKKESKTRQWEIWTFNNPINQVAISQTIESLLSNPGPLEQEAAAALVNLSEGDDSLETIVRNELGIGEDGRSLQRKLRRLLKTDAYFSQIRREIRSLADEKMSAIVWSQ